MPKRYEEKLIIRRNAKGECFMKRVCKRCGKDFIGERNTCPQCRYAKQKATGKYGKKYHRRYYKKFLSKTAISQNDKPKKSGTIPDKRRAAFEKQKRCIEAEIASIEAVGMTVNDSVAEIEAAGVVLDNSSMGTPFQLVNLAMKEAS